MNISTSAIRTCKYQGTSRRILPCSPVTFPFSTIGLGLACPHHLRIYLPVTGFAYSSLSEGSRHHLGVGREVIHSRRTSPSYPDLFSDSPARSDVRFPHDKDDLRDGRVFPCPSSQSLVWALKTLQRDDPGLGEVVTVPGPDLTGLRVRKDALSSRERKLVEQRPYLSKIITLKTAAVTIPILSALVHMHVFEEF